MPLSDRIKRFRDASRIRGGGRTFSPRTRNLETAYSDLHADLPFWERVARSLAYALENEPVHLIEEEELVGMLYQRVSDEKLDDQVPNGWREDVGGAARAQPDWDFDPFVGWGGAGGHIGWRWDAIIEQGVDGLMRRIEELLAAARDEKAEQFYRGALIIWQGVLAWNERHVAALEARAAEACGAESARLQRLIEICRRVPRFPARTFHEAAQSFHFQHQAVMFENPYGGNGPGRIDYFLGPYLERDLAQGVISDAEAKDLVDELFIRFHERLGHSDGWVEAVSPGGLAPDGSCSVNRLSHLMVHSIGALDQTHPVVYPRLSSKTPEDFVDLCVTYLLDGKNRAQIYNDDACIPAILASGTPFEDAAMYMAGGCMEISVQGAASDMNFSRIHNVAKVLELVLNGGVDLLSGARRIPHDRDLTDYADFEDLYAAFEQELARQYREMVRTLDFTSEQYARRRPCYLMSSLILDCLERGREQQDGGVRYHDYGFAPLGISAAADSLNAVKRAVFDQGTVSAGELLEAMRADFEGREDLRLALQAVPKFGVQDPEADGMMQRVLSSACRLATAPANRFGGRLKPMVFNFVWTPGASAELGARADGSRAGATIAQGLTPSSGAMTKGVTAAINSSTSLDTTCVWGGGTTMWDMDDAWINFDLMKSLLRTFMARGGMIFQGNTTSVRELEKAMANPEQYPNLIVRVGGYSARFVTLDAALQKEILSRRRHAG